MNFENIVSFLSENQNPLTSYWKDTTFSVSVWVRSLCVCYHPFSQSFDLNWTLESFFHPRLVKQDVLQKMTLLRIADTQNLLAAANIRCVWRVLYWIYLVYHHKTTLQSMSNCVSSCLQHCYLYPCLIIGHQDLTKVDLMTNLLRPLLFEAIIFRL